MGAKDWVLLVLLSILWGGSFFFFKVIVEALPPFTVVLGRVGLAAIALNLFLLAKGDRMPSSGRLWGQFFAMGTLNNVIPFTLIVFGVVPRKPGNSGGGKGPQFKTDAGRSEGHGDWATY